MTLQDLESIHISLVHAGVTNQTVEITASASDFCEMLAGMDRLATLPGSAEDVPLTFIYKSLIKVKCEISRVEAGLESQVQDLASKIDWIMAQVHRLNALTI